MSKINRLPACILLMALLAACGSGESKKSLTAENLPPYVIEVKKARDTREAVFLNEFAGNIEYVHLETREESLISRRARFYLTPEYILTTAFRQILLFDRTDGTFIREVGQYGQGPDEYRNTYPPLHFNERHQVTYVKNNSSKIVGLNPSGSADLELQLPMDDGNLVNGFAQLESDLFVGFHSNYDCKQDIKLVLFDNLGQVIKTHKNHLTCINDEPGAIFFDMSEAAFYNWNEKVFFKENFNDTLFQVSRDTLQSRAIFNSGENSLPYERKISGSKNGLWPAHFTISDIDETQDHVFFNVGFRGEIHSAYYDKINNITKLASLKDSDGHRFSNDLDGFLPFRASYATEDGKLIGYIEAPDVLEWFEENPEKAAKLPDNLKQFKNLKEDDNPVVMIVSLKD